MKPTGRRLSRSGGANYLFILVGVVLAAVVLFAVQHYRDTKDDIVIHLPKIEAH